MKKIKAPGHCFYSRLRHKTYHGVQTQRSNFTPGAGSEHKVKWNVHKIAQPKRILPGLSRSSSTGHYGNHRAPIFKTSNCTYINKGSNLHGRAHKSLSTTWCDTHKLQLIAVVPKRSRTPTPKQTWLIWNTAHPCLCLLERNTHGAPSETEHYLKVLQTTGSFIIIIVLHHYKVLNESESLIIQHLR